jgi:hypothetical protein
MRDPKYLNESGTQKGIWFMNRLDYFEFDSFKGIVWLNVKCVLLFFITLFLIRSDILTGILAVIVYNWAIYVVLLTLFLTYKKHCRYRGYFLYPSGIVKKFKAHKKTVNLTDFDSLATMQKSQVDRYIVLKTQKYDYRD